MAKKPFEQFEGNLWDRLRGESARAFEAFLAYREMGAGRSTGKVARKLGKSKALIDRWCVDWHWVERARQFDGVVYDQEQRERARQRLEMVERHATYGRWMQAKAAERIQGMLGEGLTDEQARRFMETGIKTERDALGAGFAGEVGAARPEGEGLGWVQALDDEELGKLLLNLLTAGGIS